MIAGQLSADDQALFAGVDKASISLRIQDLTASRLLEITREQGIDFATALWYQTISRLRPSDFASTLAAPESAHVSPHRVLIVPGAFHRSYSHTGANGARVLQAARELGWPAELLDVPTLGPRDYNAQVLIRRLMRIDDLPVLIVTLSKGASDLVYAFERPGADTAFARADSWLNLSGLTRGTRLFDVVDANRLQRTIIKTLLWFKGARWSSLSELRPANVSTQMRLPMAMRAVHVLGCPCRRHLHHRWAQKGYRRLERFGPNDGGGILLGEMSALQGEMVMFWGVDHYLNPPIAFDEIVRALLRHAARSAATATAMPATKSST